MSLRTVIAWLLLAVVLGAAALFVLRSPSVPAPPKAGTAAVGAKLLNVTPSSVRSISVLHPDGMLDTIERISPSATAAVGSDAEWMLRTEPAVRSSAGAGAPVLPASNPWPVTGSRMQALLRKLADAECIAVPAPDAKLGEKPTVVEIATSDGTTRTLRLADRTLAGAGLVEVQVTAPAAAGKAASPSIARAIVSDELHQVFTNPGPRAWRETAFLAGVAADASRVTLESTRQKLALAKLDGRWSLREPVAAPADTLAVQKLLTTISNVAIADFLDDGAPNASTGLETPLARLAIAADRRTVSGNGDPTVKTAEIEISIGNASDTTAKSLFASIDGQRLVLLDSRGLDALSLDPGPYIWPAATRTPAADIGIISVERVNQSRGAETGARPGSLKRSMARWVRIGPDGSERLLAEQELKDAEALAMFLSGEDRATAGAAAGNTPPGSPRSGPTILVAAPEGLRMLARVELLSLAGAPLESIEVGAGTGTVTLKTGPVFRVYPTNRVPPLLLSMCATPATAGAKADDSDAEK